MDGIAESNTGSSRGGRQRRRNNRRSGRGGSRQGKGDEEGGGNVAPALVPAESTIPLLPNQRPKSIAAPLTSAVTSLSLETVTTLLVNNPSLVNLVDHKGETALTTVCGLRKVHSAEAHTAIVQALFAHGALLSVKNRQGRAAFTLACCRHHVHLLPLLLQEAVKQEQVNPYETVPALLLATLGGLDNRIMDSDRGRWDAIVQIDPEQCFQTVEFLLEQTKLLQNGVAYVKHACQSLNARGLTPLHLAAGLFQPKTVAYLLDNHGDPHVHEDNALTPVQFLDVCFCQIESFLVDTSASDSHPLSAPNHPRGNTRRGRGKRWHVVSADGTRIEPLFMNNGCFSLRCRRLKNAVVAHLGLASILETTCGARETMGDAKLVLLDYVAGLYRAMQKNPDLRAYWDAAIRHPDIANDTASSAIKYPFTDKTLRWLVKGLTEGHPNPRFLSTWAYIIADVLKLYAPGSGGQLNNVEDLTAITTSMARSVKRLMFNLCDADTADDEVEIKLLLSKLEMLMLWLFAYVTSLPDEVDPVHDVLQVVTEPLVELKFLVHLALQTISGEVYAPDRFAAALHVLQLVAQLEACFESDQVPRLFRMFKAQVEKPHAHTWRDSDQSKVPVSLNLVSAAFGLPSSFVQWMQPLRTNVNDLIRSEVRLLPEYFQEWTTHATYITTENKLEYIETVAEERPGHFQLTINRQVSPECFLDFVIQQLTWQDYTSHSPQFQSSLAAVLDHDFDTDDNDDAWELYFESCGAVTVVGTADEDGTTHHYPSTEIELQVGGKSIRVTNDNKARYVQLRAERFFCNQMTHMQAFQKGVLDVIYKRDLLWLSATELQGVARGAVIVDVKALQEHIHYVRPAHAEHPTIVRFWQAVHEMDQPMLRQLLTFWSGSSLPPLFGYDAMGGTWSIKLTTRDHSEHWPCPQAVTCDHQLMLPEYPTKEILIEKITVALTYGAFGFDRV
ncbi:hypothetical protein AaE_012668 [Aphanomyces astaci]|uniref:E3 ubiquitin-protein ligase HACE1 n=1 Tax=Aphanomyces astaci TaxID=112090 RepID=A0A6A4ZA47_APHAT|nr:hypothetical protein AaE_012668 [Aphanomyces astaci]